MLVLVLGFNVFLSLMHNAKEYLQYPLTLVWTVDPRQLLELRLYQSVIKQRSRVFWAFVCLEEIDMQTEESALILPRQFAMKPYVKNLWEFQQQTFSAASMHLCKDQFVARVTDTLSLLSQQLQVTIQIDSMSHLIKWAVLCVVWSRWSIKQNLKLLFFHVCSLLCIVLEQPPGSLAPETMRAFKVG